MRPEDERLIAFYQKITKEDRLAAEIRAEGLPLINEDTRDKLVSLYGISDKPAVPRYIPRYYDDEVQEGPYSEGYKIAEDILRQLNPDDKSGYLHELSSWLNRSFTDSYGYEKPELQDSAIVGVGAVIKAFEIQLGYPVIEGLGSVDSEFVCRAFEEEPLRSKTSLINKVLSNKQFPQYQTSLGSFVTALSTYSPNPDALKGGASMQYRVFESIWPQILPKK